MIETAGLSVKFLKKEPYSGSYNGMRYTLKSSGDNINVYLYPEPWCLEATPEEDIQMKEFPFSSEGVDAALEWMHAIYAEKKTYWEKADKEKMAKLLQK